jgi:hypothetical protein
MLIPVSGFGPIRAVLWAGEAICLQCGCPIGCNWFTTLSVPFDRLRGRLLAAGVHFGIILATARRGGAKLSPISTNLVQLTEIRSSSRLTHHTHRSVLAPFWAHFGPLWPPVCLFLEFFN